MNATCRVLALATALLAAGCGGGDAASAPPPPADAPAMLPEDRQVIDVPVTRPANPAPVAPADLPATARAVSQMPGLSADEKVCANYAIKTTIDADGSIAATNAKMASVLGNSIVACTTPERLATIVSGGVAPDGSPLSADQRACLERTVAGDTAGTARFLSALLTVDVATITAASQHFDQACQIDVTSG